MNTKGFQDKASLEASAGGFWTVPFAGNFGAHNLHRTVTTLLHEAGVPDALAQELIGESGTIAKRRTNCNVSVGREAFERAATSLPDLV